MEANILGQKLLSIRGDVLALMRDHNKVAEILEVTDRSLEHVVVNGTAP